MHHNISAKFCEQLLFFRRINLPPARRQMLLRVVAGLVAHLFRAIDPIAEIDVRQAERAGAGDMIDDHVGPKRALFEFRVEERIDHRQAVAHHVAERHGQQLTAFAGINARAGFADAIFDDASVHVRVFHHDRVIEGRHVGHAAGLVAVVEVAAKQGELFGGGFGRMNGGDDILVGGENASHRFRRLELLGEDANGDAGAAGFTGGSIGDVLRAPKTALGQQVVHFSGARANEMGEDLPLHLVRQIGACGRRRKIELGRGRRLRVHRTVIASCVCYKAPP
ncbi:hypothetical protein AT6N2_C1176 [Agrobacterium tumefaciens]|nr:hypothetical protein AT6N2_C1176 [Agrobacterium tumefaciens]